MPDSDIYPNASGEAAKTVEASKQHPEYNSPDTLTFYSGWFCPFVQRTWITLIEKDIPYKYEEINPYTKGEYLKINPKGLVPAIRTKGGVNLYESLILNQYLEDNFPEKRALLPSEPEQKAITRIQEDLVSKRVVPGWLRTIQAQEADQQKAARADLAKALKEFGGYVKEGPFVGGKELNYVDISLAPFAVRMFLIEEHRGGPWSVEETGQAYLDWYHAVKSHPSVVKTSSELDKYDKIYQRYLTNTAQSEAAKAIREGRPVP